MERVIGKKLRVKVFKSANHIELETMINEFLETLSAPVIDIKYSSSQAFCEENEELYPSYEALILYYNF